MIPAIGDVAPVPAFAWVDVMNEHPVQSMNNDLRFGDSCSITPPFSASVIGFSAGGDSLLLEYHRSPTGGAECPAGIWFWWSVDDFLAWAERDKARRDAETKAREAVRKAVKK